MNRIKSVNHVFLVTVLLSLAASFLNSWVSLYTDNDIVLLMISQTLLVLPSILYLYTTRVNVAKAIRIHKISFSNVFLTILFAFLIMPLMSFINAISMLFVENDISGIANNIAQNNGFLLTLFMMAIVPCILEESVYRGIFYNEYSKVSPVKAIFLSGFLFGIMHQNLNQFSYAFAMGIIFAILIEATDSIIATMIVHFIINATSVIVLSVYPFLFRLLEKMYGKDTFNANELISSIQNPSVEEMTFGYIIQAYGFTALCSTILAFIVFRTIAKNSGRWEYIKSIFRKNSFIEQDRRTTEIPSQVNMTDLLSSSTNSDGTVEEKIKLMTPSLAIGITILLILTVLSEIISMMNPVIDSF